MKAKVFPKASKLKQALVTQQAQILPDFLSAEQPKLMHLFFLSPSAKAMSASTEDLFSQKGRSVHAALD